MKKVWTLLVLLCLVVGLCFALASCGETAHTEHTWDKGTVTKAATCTEKGQMTYKCTECDETKTEEIKALGHDFAAEFTSDDASHWHKCTRCDARDGEAAHKYTPDTTSPDYKPATCSVNGQAVMVCECGKTEIAPIPATGEHVKGDTMEWDDDEHYYPCTGCGLHMDAEEHTWTEGTVTGLSHTSCAEGTREDTCDECGAKRNVSITSPKAHAFNYTLNSEEHTLSAKCPDCGKELEFTNVFVRDYEDKNIGDKVADSPSPGSVVREDADGNLYGYLIHDIDTSNCAINMFTSKTELTEWTGASFRLKPWFTDTDGTVRKTETFTLTFKADGDWKDGFGTVNYGPGNMLKVGSIQTDMEAELDKWYTFTYIYQKSTGILTIVIDNGERVSVAYGRSNNDKYMTSKVLSYWHMNVNAKAAVCLDDIMFFYADEMNVEVHEHTWNDGVLTKPVTCQPGEMTYTCSICGATKMEPVTDNMTDHNPGTEYFYTTPAETAGDPDVIDLVNHWHKCTVCGEVCGTEEHEWVEGERVEPTATSKGSVTYTCVCGATKTEDIEALHHIDADKWESDENQHWNACTDEGCTDPKVNLADHDWTVKTVNKAPTCLEDGESVFVCSVCGKEKTDTVKTVGHQFTKAAYDAEEAKLTFACKNCDEKHEYVIATAAFDFEGDAPTHPFIDGNGEALTEEPANGNVSGKILTGDDGNGYMSATGGVNSTFGTGLGQYQWCPIFSKKEGVVSFDYRPTGDISKTALNLYFRNLNGSNDANKWFNWLNISGDTVKLLGKEIGKLDTTKRTEIRIDFTFAEPAEAGKQGTYTFRVYFDGILVATESAATPLFENNVNRFYLNANVGTGAGAEIDNLYLS